ncbi:MAG TPA: asparagine synthase (glutamine-hydrolyzing) [Gemmatimonadales bacterium]|nr:asparagine synthase (glutamine-hydrolyzing) [Gemmatimonadales bacterium]
MCGICGIANADAGREVPAERLTRMRLAIAHRGPDGFGERRAAGVGLAHARLSIIDVAGGAQPLANEDEAVWITYNGEVYNYQPLMARLKQAGHRFRTASDSEVLVHLYEEQGPLFVRELNGMFAFALHDLRRNRVVLARDHFGIKPLFYAVRDGTLYFGSEIKAVLAGLGRGAETSPEAVREFLLFRSVTGERSFFSGVHRLPPGCVAVWEQGRLSIEQYWVPPVPHAMPAGSLDDAAEQLDQRLGASVRAQLMSEVPLGTFCSGGVDSGLTTLYASRAAQHRLHTFSVGFDDPAWDETALARDTAERVGSEHHVFLADARNFHDALSRLIWHHDEPLGQPNSILIALLSAYARERVTVVLTGEGSDEIFGGYPRHHIARANSVAGHFPAWLRGPAAGLLGSVGGRRGRLLGSHLPLPFAEAVVLNSSVLSPALVERLTGASTRDVIELRMAQAESLAVAGDPVASISRYDQRTYLPSLLDRMDRMTMAHGLEGRVPFLDPEIAEWAGTLPPRYRLGAWKNKRVVKRLAERYLSRGITHGPKSGFGVPVGDWLRTPGWADLVATLRDPNHPATTLVDGREARRLLDAHLAGQPGLGDALWLLLNLYLWKRLDFTAAAGAPAAALQLKSAS